jgi:hypothetical protein
MTKFALSPLIEAWRMVLTCDFFFITGQSKELILFIQGFCLDYMFFAG